MPDICIIRHGKASASWHECFDPGLSTTGQDQAQSVCQKFAMQPVRPVLTSPKLRAQQTAAYLAASWQIEAIIAEAMTELPSPEGGDRSIWLRQVMQGHWSQQSPAVQAWRLGVIECVLRQPTDALIFSHYVAINVLVGAALNDERCLVFRPDNCSITRLLVANGQISLIERGEEAATKVN